jgi:hypothetical protein
VGVREGEREREREREGGGSLRERDGGSFEREREMAAASAATDVALMRYVHGSPRNARLTETWARLMIVPSPSSA